MARTQGISPGTVSGRIDFSTLPLWQEMAPITLGEMDSIRLMNRIDTKFVTSERVLLDILSDANAGGYRVCTIAGRQVTGYNSLYYDTPGLYMYNAHHNGRKTRQKVRCRTYEVSGDTFLEIKRKNNHGRTKKKRISIPTEFFSHFGDDPAAAAFLEENSWFSAGMLMPRCTTEFNRITLVNPAKTERLTIDTGLHFHNFATGRDGSLQDAVIIELKQDGRLPSPMRAILARHGVKPYRISKYIVGTVLTDPDAKDNRFKEKIRFIEKTINKKITDRYEMDIQNRGPRRSAPALGPVLRPGRQAASFL